MEEDSRSAEPLLSTKTRPQSLTSRVLLQRNVLLASQHKTNAYPTAQPQGRDANWAEVFHVPMGHFPSVRTCHLCDARGRGQQLDNDELILKLARTFVAHSKDFF